MKLIIKNYILNLINIIYLELIYHILIFKEFNITELIFIILFSIINTLFIDIISSLTKNKSFNKWFNIFINSFLSILFIAYYTNYKFYGNTLSIYSIFHGGQVFSFMTTIIKVIKENILSIILLFIPIPINIVFNKFKEGNTLNIKELSYKGLTLIILFIISLLSLNLDGNDIYSANNLYFNKHVPNQTAQKFGILTTLRLDLKRTIFNFEESSITIRNNNNNNEIEIDNKKEYNITNIDFNELATNETNNDIKKIDEYFSTITPTEKNKYTGIFKGKNLISITAEAFSPIAVNKDLTPTLYKLVNGSFKFTNFYTPVYYVSTSDGEYVTLNSLLPKESVWSFSKSSNNYLPYAYGNLFSNLGYKTYAFHDGTYKYYNRHLSHPNMGYQTYMACGNGLEKINGMHCKKWPQSDLEMINATFDMYSSDEQFMVYYMTISGHLEYNFMGNNMAYKNKDAVKDLPYSDAIKAYIASQIELDKALEQLLKSLEEKGILDDTVIVLSADHYPYGLTTNQMKEIMNIEDEKFDIHQNNLIIYNSKLTKTVEVNKIGESLDILPTILNLFGIEYDSRLLMGTDLLSNSDGLVIFNDRSWITEKGKYNAATNKFTAYTDNIEDNYVETINQLVYNKYVISKNILDTDYYRILFNKED